MRTLEVLVEVLYCAVGFETIGCFRYNELHPRGQLADCVHVKIVVHPYRVRIRRHIVRHSREKAPRRECIVEVFGYESRKQLVDIGIYLQCFLYKTGVGSLLVVSVHNGCAFLVVYFNILIAQLCELLPEGIELVVQRCAAHIQLCIVEFQVYIAFLEYEGKLQIHIVHIHLHYLYGVECASESELSVYDIARIDGYQRVGRASFQVQFPSVEVGNVRRTLYVI